MKEHVHISSRSDVEVAVLSQRVAKDLETIIASFPP